MKPVHAFLIASLAVVMTVALTALLFVQTAGMPGSEVERLDYVFWVAESSGIDAGTDVLRLGAAVPGGNHRRGVNVEHASASEVRVRVVGEGAGMLIPVPRYAELVNGSATIEFHLSPPLDAEFGEYRGTIEFRFVN